VLPIVLLGLHGRYSQYIVVQVTTLILLAKEITIWIQNLGTSWQWIALL